MAADAPAWVRDSLERRGRLAKESAERKAKRLQPAKNPWTPERKLAAAIVRAARKNDELQEALAICHAWWKRPKPPHWREREKWTPEQHREFADRLAAFDAKHQEPTPRQKELVEEDNERFVEGMPGHAGKTTYEPGTEPWLKAKSYRVMRAKFGFASTAGRAAGGNEKYVIADKFEEAYFRSTLSYSLQQFVFATPKGGRKRRLLDGTFRQPLMGGPAKDDRREYWAKLEALDQPYITLCSIMRSGWRIELDRDFASWAELRAHIERKIRKGRLACLPHVVVGHVDAEGVLHEKILHRLIWRFVIRQHQTMSYERGFGGSAPLFHVDGTTIIGTSSDFTDPRALNPRLGSALQILTDLGLVAYNDDDGYSRTAEGDGWLAAELKLEGAP